MKEIIIKFKCFEDKVLPHSLMSRIKSKMEPSGKRKTGHIEMTTESR